MGMIEKISNNAISDDLLFEISRGSIPNYSVWIQSGELLTSGTSLATIWAQGGLRPYPAAATIMKLSSSSVNDTLAGTGARKIRVVGLASDWGIQEEIVSLNGQTGVNTTKEYLRILKLFVSETGSSLYNEGDIYIGTGTITGGVPAVIYDKANGITGDHDNVSLTAAFSVPKGYRIHVVSMEISSDKGTDVRASFQARLVPAPFNTFCKVFTYQNSFEKSFPSHPIFPECYDFELRGVAGVSGNIIAGMCLIFERVDKSQPFILPGMVLSDSWSF